LGDKKLRQKYNPTHFASTIIEELVESKWTELKILLHCRTCIAINVCSD